ncbi:hypothetical protein [Pseudorhodoplanes sp.]|uniref:hypothetical protein n=1 Tax=Pseudorhodoplanes sp. TaxID=1934341 RepID=UPI00391BAB70
MSPVVTMLRLCFVVLFGAMSLTHGPIMTFSATHSAGAVEHLHATPSSEADPDCHEDGTAGAKHATCNAFGCLIAVEPLPMTARALTPILFAVMAAAPAKAPDPLGRVPALPPPRTQG